MSSLLFDLQNILTGLVPLAGTIITMANGIAQNATSKGIVEITVDGSSTLMDDLLYHPLKTLRRLIFGG